MSAKRYLVTARKYRPQLFEEIVAQEHVAETLKNAIRFDRLAHAYLFSGPRGVGKTTAARILAKAVNCTTSLEDREGNAEPCRTCESCRTFEEGRSLNIIEIDAASNRRIDDIRELLDAVRIPPQGGRKKVYIVDEVHMLTTPAFNALLKTLEEPPPHVLFIFATTEPHKVVPTILSRCQRFDFRRIAVPEIVSRLEEICSEEEITADDASLMLIARKGDGALRDALSVFDQAVSLCGTNLEYSELAQALGVVDIDLYFEVTRCVSARDAAGMLKLVERIVRSGYDLAEFLVGLAEHLRNLLVGRVMSDSTLIEADEATRQRYDSEAEHFSEADLLRLLTLVSGAEDAIKNSPQPRLKLETALLKMATISLGADLRNAIEKIDHLESLVREQDPDAEKPREASSTAKRGETPSASRTKPKTDSRPDDQTETRSEKPAGRRPEKQAGPPPEKQAPSQSEKRAAQQEENQTAPTKANQVSEPEIAAPPRSPVQPEATSPAEVLGQPAIKRRTPPAENAGSVATTAANTDVAVQESPDAGALGRVWSDLLLQVKEDKIHVGSLLQHSRPEEFRDGAAVIGVPDEFHHRLLVNQHDYVMAQLRPLLSEPLETIRFTIRTDLDAPDSQETGSDFNPYEYMQRKRQENPVIRAIFDQFGGELVW